MHHSAEFRVPKAQPAGYRPEVDLRLIHATGTVRFDGLVVKEIAKPTQKQGAGGGRFRREVPLNRRAVDGDGRLTSHVRYLRKALIDIPK